MFKRFKPFKKSRLDFAESIKYTFFNEWLSLSIIGFIAVSFLIAHFIEDKEQHWFHVALEFFGVATIFLVVEHVLRQLESGVSDPKRLPTEQFLNDIKSARNNLFLFDIFLETLLLEDENCYHLKKNLKRAIADNESFKANILLLNPDSKYAFERAEERGIKPDDYKNDMIRAFNSLYHIKDEICDALYKDKGNKGISIEELKNRIQFRFYDCEPQFSMYSIEGRYTYISFYPKGIKSTDSRQLYAPRDTSFGKNIFSFFKIKLFDEIWLHNSVEQNESLKIKI